MGGRGTEVAREAASLVLLNDQFSAILGAIRLGRRIFANLRQAMVYTLAVHLPIVALSILPLLLGLPALLGPIHIAFLELLIAPIGSLLFESNPAHPQLMQEPPRSARESLLTPPQLLLSLAMGSVVSLVVLLFYRQQLQVGLALPSARAAAFTLLVLASVLMALPLRSIDTHWRSMFVGLGGVAVGIAAGSVLALMLALGLPGLAGAFGFALPSFKALALCLLLALCTLLLLSLLKQWLGRKAEGGRTRLPRSVSGAARGD
jgi:Ca2+-transporting ATPase